MQDQDTIGRPAGSLNEDDPTKRGADAVAAEAKEAVSREMQDAQHRISSATKDLRSDATGKVSSVMSDRAEHTKEQAADALRSFAETIRNAADDLGERDQSMAARFVQEAAHGLERVSDGLQARSVNEMVRSISAYGRENPATFIAGCLIAGVAAGRFLIASGEREARYGRDDRGYGGPGEAWRDQTYAGSGGQAASELGGTGFAAAAGYSDQAASGAAGAEFGAGRSDVDVSRQAGAFGGPVSPSSADRAPGDNGDAQGTAMDVPQPSLTADTGLGERHQPGTPGTGVGGRNGDL